MNLTDVIAAAPPRTKPKKEWKEWLCRKEAAAYLTETGRTISHRTLANMASNNNALGGPPFTRHSWKVVQYLRADLDDWKRRGETRIG